MGRISAARHRCMRRSTSIQTLSIGTMWAMFAQAVASKTWAPDAYNMSFLPAQLYVQVTRAATGAKDARDVGMAATTVKGYDIYEEQFATLVRDFRSGGSLEISEARRP